MSEYYTTPPPEATTGEMIRAAGGAQVTRLCLGVAWWRADAALLTHVRVMTSLACSISIVRLLPSSV